MLIYKMEKQVVTYICNVILFSSKNAAPMHATMLQCERITKIICKVKEARPKKCHILNASTSMKYYS